VETAGPRSVDERDPARAESTDSTERLDAADSADSG
jgi:hypothetical protein